MENKLKEMYREIPAPDIKAAVLAQIHGEKPPKTHRRLKTTAILAAAAILLTVTAGAVVVGSVKLLPVAPPPATTVDRVIETVPEVVDKVTGFIEKQKNKDILV